jgi:N-acetylmuramoyl-L-alanine amidase
LKRISLFFVMIVMLPFCEANTVKDLSLDFNAGQWQFNIATAATPQFKVFSLTRPQRIVIDIQHIDSPVKSSLLKLPQSQSPLRSIRSSLSTAHVLRLVLDLNHRVNANTRVHTNGLIMTFDKLAQTIKKNDGASRISVVNDPVGDGENLVNIASPKLVQKKRNIMIVVDPGHGGKDPGATSRSGVHEKAIVLQISKKIVAALKQHAGFDARLTRTGDYYLTLRQRLALARKYKADMFIAIHADAFRNARAHGVSVFGLSLKGATSEAARWLADRENQSELIGGAKLDDKSNMLKSVLINLSQGAAIRSSLAIGKDIIQQTRKIAVMHHPRVEQAAFVVLKSPDIPSLLVETGFVSNAKEERRLINPSYQKRLAQSISTGIVNAFSQSPPSNTWVSYWKIHPEQVRHYRVRRGDSLSLIARRFNTSVAALRAANRLASNKILTGTMLAIK